VVENLAARMRNAGFQVYLEPLGLEDPTIDAMKIFVLNLRIYFSNIITELKELYSAAKTWEWMNLRKEQCWQRLIP
jgi:hypothetical protein